MALARFSPLALLLGGGILAPGLTAQSTEIVFDLRADELPGLGAVTASANFNFSSNPTVFVDDEGHWYASGFTSGGKTVFDEDGVIFVQDPFATVSVEGVEDNGSLTIIQTRFDGQGNVSTLYSYSNGTLNSVLTTGADLSLVTGLPPGSTLARIVEGEIHGAEGVSIIGGATLPNGESTGSAFLNLTFDAQGNVDGGSLVAERGTPPPVGSGDIVDIRQFTGNAQGESMWAALIQPGSIARIFRNGSAQFSNGQMVGGVNLFSVSADSTLDYGPNGRWLAAMDGGSVTAGPPYRGIIVRSGQIFAEGGVPLTGFGDVRRILSYNVRLLKDGFVSWVHEDSLLPPQANNSYVLERTRAFREADVRFGDRFSTNLLGNEFNTSPSGQYIAAYVSLQPGLALVVVDALAAPDQPCTQGPDAFAPNQDCLSAFGVGAITDPVVFPELIAETGGPDFIRMTIPAETEVVIETVSDFEASDLDLVLWNADCAQPVELTSDTSFSDNPELLWRNPSAQPIDVILEVRVSPSSPYPCGVYDLELESRPTAICPPGIVEDPYEPNDLMSQAFPLLPGTYDGLFLSDRNSEGQNELDRFAVRVEPLGQFRLHVDHAASMVGPSAINATVLSPGGFFLATRTSYFDAPFEINWTNDNPQHWSGSTPEALDIIISMDWIRGNSTVECSFYELEIETNPGPDWTSFCGPANANSTGGAGRMVPEGSASLGAFDLVLAAEGMPNNQFGYFIASPNPGFEPMVAGSSGNLCLDNPIGRYNFAPLFTGTDGRISYLVDPSVTPTPTGTVAIQAGQTWHYQAWYRDFVGSPTSNFTDAVAITFVN